MEKEIKILKAGTLCFWGDWFGRPMDNYHTVKSAFLKEEDNELYITFDEGELCVIVNPVGIESNAKRFCVKSANKIIWQWFYYGRSKTADNLCVTEYELQKDGLIKITQNALSQKIFIKPTPIKSKNFFAMEIC